MDKPSTKVPTARNVAIAAIEEAMLGTLPVPFGVLSEKVETLINAVTAAIEADRAALRSAVVEECARVAEERCHEKVCHQDAAARIRALAARTGGNENE